MDEIWTDYLTKKQVAKLVQTSPRTIDAYMMKGILPFIKMPTGSVRFRRSQIIEALNKFQVHA